MQLSEQQLWVLNELGITIWQRREIENLQSDPVQSLPATDDKLVYDCSLLMSVPANLPLAEQQLFSNICKALNLSSAVMQTCTDADLPKVAVVHDKPVQVLCFGTGKDNLTVATRERSQTLAGLQEMLQTPALKAQVWSALVSTIKSVVR